MVAARDIKPADWYALTFMDELNVSPIPLERPLRFWERFTYRQTWKFTAPFRFRVLGGVHEIPAGFNFDFASCPRPLMLFISDSAIRGRAPAVHDFAYWAGFPKHIADALFWEALKLDNISAAEQWIMVKAVEYGGTAAYAAHRQREMKL